ncbi:MAG: Hsp33 family molecular chaperone [Rhodobiaceae bacterium]|nr:Hsp33 family molecular chaperone [Rhodobiaceae bacterium]
MVSCVSNQDQSPTAEPLPLDDMVLPFQIEGVGVRGRIAHLSTLVNEVMTRHDYPEPVAILLGEALTLVALLGTALKFEGRLTLQTKSDGPLSMLVADFDSPGKLRGYAHINRDAVIAAMEAGLESPADLMGKGYLALTIDQGADMDRYQGIVQLGVGGLTEAAHEYFTQSEQIATRVHLAVGPLYERDDDGEMSVSWRAGAIMIQHLPEEGGLTGFREPEDERALSDAERDWEHATILLGTLTDAELLDPEIGADRLLYRLYHEDGVRVYTPHTVAFGCRCSRERIEGVLRTFDEGDLDHMTVNGQIETKCEFCAQMYEFDPAELRG